LPAVVVLLRCCCVSWQQQVPEPHIGVAEAPGFGGSC
jgi:hypothetical protein